MVTREQLIDRWQTRLGETQSPAREVSPQGGWVQRVYSRIYRFLLACYGRGDWKTEPQDDARVSAPSVLKDKPELAGKPPKRQAQMSKVLKSVHGANAESVSALPAGGYSAQAYRKEAVKAARNTWVDAAEFPSLEAADAFVALLAMFDIRSKLRYDYRRYHIEVLHRNSTAALSIFQEHHDRLEMIDRLSVRNAEGPPVASPFAPSGRNAILGAIVATFAVIALVFVMAGTVAEGCHHWFGWPRELVFAIALGFQILTLGTWLILRSTRCLVARSK